MRKDPTDRNLATHICRPKTASTNCAEPFCTITDSLQVEYALSRSMSPTMVAEYQRLLIPKEVLQAQIEEYAQIALGEINDE